MKTLQIDLEDAEHEALVSLKGALTWKQYLMLEHDERKRRE